MEIDTDDINQPEEEKRRVAEHECAHAVAHEICNGGVKWVSAIEKGRQEGRG